MIKKGEQSAEEVTQLSLQARKRYVELEKKTSPNMLEAVLTAGQDLIGEPPGEAGRGIGRTDEHGRPLGYNLQTVIGLEESPATYRHHRTTVKNCAVGIVWGRTFREQRDACVEATIAAALKRLPVYHLYENRWPLREILKGLCKSDKDQQQKLLKKMKEAKLEGAPEARSKEDRRRTAPAVRTGAAPRGDAISRTANRREPPEPNCNAENYHAAIEDYDKEPDPPSDEDDPADDEDQQVTPPPPVPKKRGRSDPDRNLPGNLNPQAKKLKPGPVANSSKKPVRRETVSESDSGDNGGPGPRSLAARKALAHQKAAELQKKRAGKK